MRSFRTGVAVAVAAAGFAATAPVGAARCVPVDRPPFNRICVVTQCDYDPETGYIRCR